MIVRRCLPGGLSLLGVVVAVGVFGASVAFAAAPNVPGRVVAYGVTATSANVFGVVDPSGEEEGGTYEFVYEASKSECDGAGSKLSGRGLYAGVSGEEVFGELTGLEPHMEYAVCLLVRNLKGEKTVGPMTVFETSPEPLVPEKPETGVAVATPTTALLKGRLNPVNPREAEPGAYEFIYRQSSSKCEGEGSESTGRVQIPVEPGRGVRREEVQQEVSGLLPNTQYSFCLRAWNDAGQFATSLPETFTTGSEEPTVLSTSTSLVKSQSLYVNAQIEPGGLPTSYVVQYGTSTSYGSETKPASIVPLSGSTEVPVSVFLDGLQPGTEYHLRILATNADGIRAGSDVTFITYSSTLNVLPDDRVYEMVSTFGNPDTEAYIPTGLEGEGQRYSSYPFEVAPSGDRVTFAGSPGTSGGSGNEFNTKGNQYLATRSESGWDVQNMTAPGDLHAGYVGFADDLSTGVTSVGIEPPVTTTEAPYEPPETGGRKIYEILYARIPGSTLFQPLATANPLRSNEELFSVGSPTFTESFDGVATGDHRYIFESTEPPFSLGTGTAEQELTSDFAHEVAAEPEIKNLDKEFERLENERREIEAKNGNRVSPESNTKGEEADAKLVQTRAKNRENSRVGLYSESAEGDALVSVLPDGSYDPNAKFTGMDNAISADGSRIFWTSGTEGPDPGEVFVREGSSRTVQVSSGAASFWGATPDGRYAFYIEKGKLWRFDVDQESRIEIAGSSGGVQGVVGFSEAGDSGAYVYFVSGEQLTGEPNSAGGRAVEGLDNLYVYGPDPENGGASQIVFIASLGEEDGQDWNERLSQRSAGVTPDGHAAVFSSHLNLTGDKYPGENSEEEVYVYSLSDRSLHCASCRPQASGGHEPGSFDPTHVHRWFSEDGNQVFFESAAPLVSRDVNGSRDVYEWERDGAGSCSEPEGCVYLISNGIEARAFLLGASANGDDVFFYTAQRLVPEDGDEAIDVYDARVNGLLPVSPPECVGTGCQGIPVAAPAFATPASVTFAGIGNFAQSKTTVSRGAKSKESLTNVRRRARALRACRRDRGKRRSQCEALVHKRLGGKANLGRAK